VTGKRRKKASSPLTIPKRKKKESHLPEIQCQKNKRKKRGDRRLEGEGGILNIPLDPGKKERRPPPKIELEKVTQ